MAVEPHFRAAAAAVGLHPEESVRIWSALARAYGAPDRHYHNLDHLAAMLSLLAACLADSPAAGGPAEAAGLAGHPALVLAVLFHDAVYDTRRADNEAASAEAAARDLANLDPVLAARVGELVRLTAHGAAEPAAGDTEAALLCDADLAVLGREPAAYAAYAAAIRREYAWVSDADYRAGRARVLQAFLDRPAIYLTPWFAGRFETAARANLARELASLR